MRPSRLIKGTTNTLISTMVIKWICLMMLTYVLRAISEKDG